MKLCLVWLLRLQLMQTRKYLNYVLNVHAQRVLHSLLYLLLIIYTTYCYIYCCHLVYYCMFHSRTIKCGNDLVLNEFKVPCRQRLFKWYIASVHCHFNSFCYSELRVLQILNLTSSSTTLRREITQISVIFFANKWGQFTIKVCMENKEHLLK